MNKMIMLGKCPNWVLQKAKTLINTSGAKHKVSKKKMNIMLPLIKAI